MTSRGPTVWHVGARSWDQIACKRHHLSRAGLRPYALMFFDVSTPHFETDQGDWFDCSEHGERR